MRSVKNVSRFFRRIADRELALGTIVLDEGPSYVETLGYTGLDFCVIDLMVASIGWGEAAHHIRAANRHDLTPFMRVPVYPREGERELDGRVAADVSRALAIGAEGVMAPVNTAGAVAALIEPASDAHQRLFIDTSQEHKSAAQLAYVRAQPAPIVFPVLETRTAMDNLAEILAVPGLPAVMLGMGDLSKALGSFGEDRSPVMREAVLEVIRRAAERNVLVIANVLSYQPGRLASDEIAAGVAWLREAGVAAAWLPRPTVLLQAAYTDLIGRIRPEPS